MNAKHAIRFTTLFLLLNLALLSGIFGRPSAQARPLCLSTTFPSFGYAMARTGWNPVECTLSASSLPTAGWITSYSTTLGTREGISAVGGLAYHSVKNVMYAVNNVSGAPVWTFATGAAIQGSATFYQSKVFFGSGDTSVYALDATTGSPVWIKTLGVPITSTPAVWSGLVVVSLGDGSVAAFDVLSGSLVWRVLLGLQISTPAVVGNQIYVSVEVSAAPQSEVVALDAATGMLLWTSPVLPAVLTVPALTGSFLYIGTSNPALSVVSLKPATGAINWITSFGEPVSGKPATDASQVYVVGGSSGKLFALDASAGSIIWGTSAPFGPLYFSASPTVANGVVYVGAANGGSTGWLYAFKTNGAPIWNRQVAGFVNSPPTVVNGWIYISTSDSSISVVYGFHA